MHFLITGGLGFIGRYLAQKLDEKGHCVVLFDNASSFRDDTIKLSSAIKMVRGSILNSELLLQVMKKYSIEQVIHAASIAGVIASIDDPLATVQVNILGGLQVLEAAQRTGVRRLIDLSSEDIYGSVRYEPVDEEHPQAPVNPYAITKQCLEQFGTYMMTQGSLSYVAVRLCWVYGPTYPRIRLPRPFLEDALSGRQTVLPQGGDHRLDLTYIEDAIEGICLVAEAPTLAHQAYNIASGKAYTVFQIAESIQKLIPTWRYEIGPGPLQLEGRYTIPPKGAIDITRASSELGYVPRWQLMDGLASELQSIQTKIDRNV